MLHEDSIFGSFSFHKGHILSRVTSQGKNGGMLSMDSIWSKMSSNELYLSTVSWLKGRGVYSPCVCLVEELILKLVSMYDVVVSDYNNKDMITAEESLHGVAQCVCQVFQVRPLAVSRAELASCEFLNCVQWWGRHGHTAAAVPVPHWQLPIAIASRKLAESFK